jgi:hypothetical protein
MYCLRCVFVICLVVVAHGAMAQTVTTTDHLQFTTQAPPPIPDPICPAADGPEKERWDVTRHVREVKSRAEAVAFQQSLLDKSTAVAAAYDACAAGYTDPTQKQSYYHARIRAGAERLSIANALLPLRRPSEAKVALQTGNDFLLGVLQADAKPGEINAGDLKLATMIRAIFATELQGIADRGAAYNPNGMFRALASPQPAPT